MANFIAILSILIVIPSLVISVDIRVRGPDEVFTGDYEQFTCTISGDGVTGIYGQDWRFMFENGSVETLEEADMLMGLETKTVTTDEVMVTSFLKARPGVTNVICEHSPKVTHSKTITVKDLKSVSAENDPCFPGESNGAPVTTLFIPSANPITPSYRKTHFLSDQPLNINQGVDELRLECYNPSDASTPPKWMVDEKTLSKLKYASWIEKSKHTCEKQVFHIYKVAGSPGSTFSLNMDCVLGSSKSGVHLNFEIPSTRSGNPDFNSTENCIDEVVNKFYYNKELTGVGIGGGGVLLLLMFGMAFMKRQLNQQQNINREQQKKLQQANSTEQLNPSLVP